MPDIRPPVKTKFPFTTISFPGPSEIVRLAVCVSVPPASTTVWSVVTPLLTVTVCPVKIVIIPSALDGEVAVATKLAPLCRSHVDAALQLPDAALW